MLENNLKIDYILIDKLIPYAKNSKQHSETQISQVAASIKEFGFLNPIIITNDMQIVAGHCRLLAAQKLGLRTCPIIKAENLTKNQIKAYRIVDNKLTENSDWLDEMLKLEISDLKTEDFNIDLLGFDQNELDELLENKLDKPYDKDEDNECFKIMVYCENELKQKEIYNELINKAGIDCKLL